MKLPNRVRIVWWVLLVGFFAYLVSQRYDSITSGAASAIDIIIFLILIALVTIPLFREVTIFGVGLKKELDNLREEMITLKSEIHSTQNVYVYPTPSPDSKLPEIKKIAEATLKEELGELAVESRPVLEATIPNDVSYLFVVRYNIENELKRITDFYWPSEGTESYPKTVIQKLEFLVYIKVIHRNLAFILKEMFARCSAVIHGEQFSDQGTQWIRQDAPGIIEALKAIPEGTEVGKE